MKICKNKMEALKKSLTCFQWSLCLSGCLFFPSKSFLVTFLIQTHGFFLILASVNLILQSWIKHSEKKFLHIMYIIWDFSLAFCISSSIILFWKTRSQLLSILRFLSNRLTTNDLQHLRRVSLFFFIYRIFITITTRYVRRILTYLSGRYLDPDEIMNWYLTCHHSDIMSLTVSVIFVKVIHFTEDNSMKNLCKRLKAHETEQDEVYDEVSLFIRIKDKLMSLISLLPFQSFFFCFVSGFCNICHYENVVSRLDTTSIQKTQALFHFLENISSLGLLGYLLSVTSCLCSRTTENLDLLQSLILRSNRKQEKWIITLDKIKEGKNYEYKVLDMFKLNKALLPTFVASFVTFTALFEQIIYQRRET